MCITRIVMFMLIYYECIIRISYHNLTQAECGAESWCYQSAETHFTEVNQ